MFLGDYVGWMIITVLNWIIIISLSGDDYLLDGGIFLLFPFFGVQLLGFSYMISFWFSQPSYAVVATPGILILQLVLSQVLVGIFQLILVQGAGVDVDDDTNLGLFIWSVTLLCPLGSLGTVDFDAREYHLYINLTHSFFRFIHRSHFVLNYRNLLISSLTQLGLNRYRPLHVHIQHQRRSCRCFSSSSSCDGHYALSRCTVHVSSHYTRRS